MKITELFLNEIFYDADCLFDRNVGLVEFSKIDSRLMIGPPLKVDQVSMTHVFELFSWSAGPAKYGGGETSSHGSSGFFYKRKNNHLEWILICKDSEPFIEVKVIGPEIHFFSRSGDRWIVSGNDLAKTKIERKNLK